jgi:hypothetical protein
LFEYIILYKELDGPAVSAFRRAIAEVKQHWSVIGLVTKILLSRAPPFFGRLSRWSRLQLQSLAPTNPHCVRVVGYGPFSLCVIHKESLCPSNVDIKAHLQELLKSRFNISRDLNFMLSLLVSVNLTKTE